jgi:hypothetical protein
MESSYKPSYSLTPVEAIINERRKQYYALLGTADTKGDATPFVEFMAEILRDALVKYGAGDVTGDVTGEVKRLLMSMKGEMKRAEIKNAMGLKSDDHFRVAYLLPALAEGVIEMTQPASPKSPTQR